MQSCNYTIAQNIFESLRKIRKNWQNIFFLKSTIEFAIRKSGEVFIRKYLRSANNKTSSTDPSSFYSDSFLRPEWIG